MGVGPFRKRRPFAEAAAEIAPRVALDPIADYLMWILVVPREDVPPAAAQMPSLCIHSLSSSPQTGTPLSALSSRKRTPPLPSQFPSAPRNASSLNPQAASHSLATRSTP